MVALWLASVALAISLSVLLWSALRYRALSRELRRWRIAAWAANGYALAALDDLRDGRPPEETRQMLLNLFHDDRLECMKSAWEQNG